MFFLLGLGLIGLALFIGTVQLALTFVRLQGDIVHELKETAVRLRSARIGLVNEHKVDSHLELGMMQYGRLEYVPLFFVLLQVAVFGVIVVIRFLGRPRREPLHERLVVAGSQGVIAPLLVGGSKVKLANHTVVKHFLEFLQTFLRCVLVHMFAHNELALRRLV